MIAAVPFACFLSLIRPPGIKFEDSLLQLAPVDKVKCPFVKNGRDMRFQLYTRYNPVQPQELLLGDDERLFASHINFNEPTVIYFHAFMEEPQDGSGVYIREAYILRGDTNVIMVDAQTLEAGPWYFRAAENTWFIGQFAAQFIDYLVSRGLDLSNTHLIGHSLGAQSAGVAGSATKSGRVSRITGLDPAFPLFDKLPLEQRLDPTDAKFVDVIHTDAGIFGFPGQVGHADFFPNGGISPQPGCEIKTVLPQQQLLNKCNVAHMHSYYAFHLAPNTETSRRYHLRKDLEALYSLIQNIKNNSKRNIPNDIKKAKIVKKSTEKKDKKTHNKVNKSTAESNIKVNYNKLYYNNDNYTKNDNTVITKDIENISALKSIVYGTFIVQNVDTKSDIIDTSDKAPNTEDITLETNDNVDIDINGTPLEKKTDKNDTATELQEKTPEKNDNSETHTTRTRSKRFINPFRQSETAENNNFVQNMLGFLLRHRKSVIPVITVMREISTLVKTANGELNHNTKERNNYIGAAPPALNPVTYNLELDGESKLTAFVKRLLGLKTKGDRLTITGTGK